MPPFPPRPMTLGKMSILTGERLGTGAEQRGVNVSLGAPSSSDSVPNVVWIWDIRKLRLLAVLEQLCTVRALPVSPQQPRLAICTGGSKVYLWSPAGCVSVQVPGEGERAGTQADALRRHLPVNLRARLLNFGTPAGSP